MIPHFDPSTTDLSILARSIKSGGAVILGAITAVVAQMGEIDFGTIGNITGIGAIAVLVGRYTFRQLEDFRRDLRAARERIDFLAAKIDVMEERERQLIGYSTRLERVIVTQGVDASLLPAFPNLPPLPLDPSAT